MKTKLPVHFDPVHYAKAGYEFNGSVSQAQLQRLMTEVLPSDEDVQVEIRFHTVGRRKYPAMAGRIQTTLMLECQRCMEPMAYAVDTDFAVCFIDSETQEDELPEGYEAYISSDEVFVLNDLLEEELLLHVPLIPKHEDCENPYLTNDAEEEHPEESEVDESRPNPFAKLAALKKH